MLIREMSVEECSGLLARIGLGRLACALDNQPYIVPLYFVVEGVNLYGFSTLGRKIEWMRANPLVCVEADEVINDSHWKSVVAFGRYEEFPDIAKWEVVRTHAHRLLQRRALWWQPAYVSTTHHGKPHSLQPVFYRIHLEEITGREASRDTHELASTIERTPISSVQNRAFSAVRRALGVLRRDLWVRN